MKNLITKSYKCLGIILFFLTIQFWEIPAFAISEEAFTETNLIQKRPCDPVPLRPQIESIPDGQGIKCGDNRLEQYISSCVKFCGSTGCHAPISCDTAPIECTKSVEVCDGKNLDQQTCKKLGFFAGQLKCGSSCQGFDVSDCRLCKEDALTKCTTATLTDEDAEIVFSSSKAPLTIPTTNGIAMAWEYTVNGTSEIGLASIDRSAQIHISNRSQIKAFVETANPKLMADEKRLVLIAQKKSEAEDSKILLQEFDLTGKVINEAFSIPGHFAIHLAWEKDLLKIDTWDSKSNRTFIQYIDLKLKQAVAPVAFQKINSSSSPKLKKTSRRSSSLSALSTSELLTHRFKIASGQQEFEGAFVQTQANVLSMNGKKSKTFPMTSKNAKIVVAIKKAKP